MIAEWSETSTSVVTFAVRRSWIRSESLRVPWPIVKTGGWNGVCRGGWLKASDSCSGWPAPLWWFAWRLLRSLLLLALETSCFGFADVGIVSVFL